MEIVFTVVIFLLIAILIVNVVVWLANGISHSFAEFVVSIARLIDEDRKNR